MKKGFYQYDTKKKVVDESVYPLLSITKQEKLSAEQISLRCVYMMLNEAVRCLDEGIIRNPRDGDIGAIFGIGFPPFLGGPFNYIDKIGAAEVVKQMNAFKHECGERFTPCAKLVEMAESNTNFYG